MISIATISRSNNNLKNLVETIPGALSGLGFELLIAWNGAEKCALTGVHGVKVFNISPYHFSKNNNYLAEQSQHEYILFLNDDILLDEKSIRRALEFLRADIDVGVVGANLRYPSGRIQHAGIELDGNGLPYHRKKNEVFYLDPTVRETREFPAVTGAFLLTRKADFFSVDGFNRNCDVAAQDVVLCMEIKRILGKKIIYHGGVRAIHYENVTRKLFDSKITPQSDLDVLRGVYEKWKSHSNEADTAGIRLRIVTEKEGWILYRKAAEIAKLIPNTVINGDYPEANVHYYINYGYYSKRPKVGKVVANFTHFDPRLHADKWEAVASEVDHCIAVSNQAKSDLLRFGIDPGKISVIIVGADAAYRPKMTLGIVGRVYAGGRKGEHLVKALLEDEDLMKDLRIVSTNDGWGVPVVKTEVLEDFYNSIDFLLVPSLLEGGPVPFMEALACGVLSIAPPIGVIPDFPHIAYRTGDISSLKSTITQIKNKHISKKRMISNYMENYNWSTWASSHARVFKSLIA